MGLCHTFEISSYFWINSLLKTCTVRFLLASSFWSSYLYRIANKYLRVSYCYSNLYRFKDNMYARINYIKTNSNVFDRYDVLQFDIKKNLMVGGASFSNYQWKTLNYSMIIQRHALNSLLCCIRRTWFSWILDNKFCLLN